MSHYHDPDDLGLAGQLLRLAPVEARAYLGLKSAAERDGGAIPAKYRELISIAVALTTSCPYCIEAHAGRAVKTGASREELAEAVFIAAAVRAGSASAQGLLALRLFDDAAQGAAGG